MAFQKRPFSEYKAGFEIRTTRLCKRILLFTISELPGGSALVKSVSLSYATRADGFRLQSITEYGYIKSQWDVHRKAPPAMVRYRHQEWSKEVRSFPVGIGAPAGGLDRPRHQFIDLYNEGLAGMLTEHGETFFQQPWPGPVHGRGTGFP
jgi:hypothetical protein